MTLAGKRIGRFVAGLSPEESFSAGLRMALDVAERRRAGLPANHYSDRLVRDALAAPPSPRFEGLTLDEAKAVIAEVLRGYDGTGKGVADGDDD